MKIFFNNLLKLSWIILAAVILVTSCKKDDAPKPILVEDGIYLTGVATGFTGLDSDAMMQPGRVEGAGFASMERDGMYEKFMYLTAGSFNIVKKAGVVENKYGWNTAGAQILDNVGNDEVQGDVTYGTYVANGTAFSVTEAGIYHIIYDETTSKVFYVKVTHWAVIGDATENGWSGEYAMTTVNASATEAKFEVTNLTLRERGGFKFRYNSGWKITVVKDVFVIFANVGRGETNADFIMGGGTFPYPTTGEGAYTVSLMWSLENGWSYTATKTGTVDPLPEYPATMYMIGSALNMTDSDGNNTPDGWQWDLSDFPMVPVHSQPHLFWKIVWLYEGGEFKFAPARAWAGDFGKEGDATDGVYAIGGTNIPVSTSGYYMVVVNLETETIEVAQPMVYGIGDAFGGFDAAVSTNLFTVDNTEKVIYFNNAPAAGNLRMHVTATTLTKKDGNAADWWQAEFSIINGDIEFRGTGGDQSGNAAVTAGQRIELDFIALTGSVTTGKK